MDSPIIEEVNISVPAISIIVPIYNMEHLMRRCIDSILRQTFTDYELLLIDDGSADGSPAICDEYAAGDKRITAYHKPNGGLSDARNFGLARAKGKYTIFCDPDDWVDPEGLDRLYEKAEAEQADMTICDLYREDEYARHYVKQQPASLEPDNVLTELFSGIGGFTVNKLIRRDLYERYNILYPEGIYGCEDQYTMAQFLLHDIRIAYVPVAFYHYMYNAQSLIRYYDEHTYDMDVHVLQLFSELLKDHPAHSAAYNSKYDAIFTRAFWNGGKYYSSALFRRRFAKYSERIRTLREPAVVKACMLPACRGFYRPAHRIIRLLFHTKREIKKIIHLLDPKKQ